MSDAIIMTATFQRVNVVRQAEGIQFLKNLIDELTFTYESDSATISGPQAILEQFIETAHLDKYDHSVKGGEEDIDM